MRKYLEILEVFFLCLAMSVLGCWLSGIKENIDTISFRIGQIEESMSGSSEDIEQMKKEMVILDSVCQKVLNNEW